MMIMATKMTIIKSIKTVTRKIDEAEQDLELAVVQADDAESLGECAGKEAWKLGTDSAEELSEQAEGAADDADSKAVKAEQAALKIHEDAEEAEDLKEEKDDGEEETKQEEEDENGQ
jgi:hypothetical protein